MDPKPYARKLLKADGTVADYPPTGKHYTLKEMQAAVGGYIEILHLPQNYLMVVNEEGKLERLPINDRATELYDHPDDVVVGDVLVCGHRDIK